MDLADFIFEAGLLKETPRSGWLTIKVSDPESVAEHSFRTALIGWILARLENADGNKVIKMCLAHDLEETRLGDLHAVNKAYLKARRDPLADMLKGLECEGEMRSTLREFAEGKTKEAVVARDADKLEMVFQAKEYLDLGNMYAKDWVKSGMKALRTGSARGLALKAIKRDSRAWLFGIK